MLERHAKALSEGARAARRKRPEGRGSGDWTSCLDPVLTHFHHEFAFIVKTLQLSRITNHLPGIQPMGFNQPPYSSGEIPVCFLHFKNRSEAPQTEAPVSVASRFLAPRWRRRTHTSTPAPAHPSSSLVPAAWLLIGCSPHQKIQQLRGRVGRRRPMKSS